MQRVSHKMEGLIQAQKKLLEQSQADSKSFWAKDKSHYIVAVGAIAAGLTIAVIVLLAKSIFMTNTVDIGGVEKVIAVHKKEIGKLTDNIARLNGRVESLTGTIAELETRLTRVMAQAGSVISIDAQHGFTAPPSTAEHAASTADRNSTGTAREVGPTYIVKTRVNLRPAASLNAKPVAVLDPGTEVEYLRESDGWYYVDTPSHGKGWCSSDYLSPVPLTQSKSRVR